MEEKKDVFDLSLEALKNMSVGDLAELKMLLDKASDKVVREIRKRIQ